MDFLELEDIIKQIISDPTLDLGYDYQPDSDTSKFELNEEDKKELDIPEAICEEPDNWETESSDSSEKDPRKATHFMKAISSAWLMSPQLHEDRVFLCHFGLSKPISFRVGGGRSHKLKYKVGHYKTIVNFKV